MGDWIHTLPIWGMAVVILGGMYSVAAAIHWVVVTLATGERARAFKSVTPGLLPPLGILFGLLIAFVAAQVWAMSSGPTPQSTARPARCAPSCCPEFRCAGGPPRPCSATNRTAVTENGLPWPIGE